MLSISIVIPTMNRFDSLKRTICNITKGTLLPKEIIIVDQSQEDEIVNCTIEFLEKQKVKCIYLHQDQPSLTKARNYGMKYVTGNIVIQMDDDVDIKTNTLGNIINIFSNKRVSMLAGLNEGDEESTDSILGYIFFKKNWFKRNIGHVTLSMYGRFPVCLKNETLTEWSMGFFSVYRTELIRKWNLSWDENLKGYAYPEDLDFSFSYYKKSKENGLYCIMSDKVIVKHNVSKEWRIPSKNHTRMIIINREYLRHKHFGNNYLSIIETNIADFGELIRRIVKREKPREQLNAIIEKIKNIKKIRLGELY